MYKTNKPYIEKILSLVKKTYTKNIRQPASSDGIGTKGFYHWQQKSFRNAVLDALAMNFNDMAVLRARICSLQDHIILSLDDEKIILEIVENLVDECKKRNIQIIAGETSIHNDFVGLEISVAVQGVYENYKKNNFPVGDVLVGIRSSGLHSNGFTKVREVFKNEFRKEFIEPTLIYYDKILELNSKFNIHGMEHITGGAFARLKKFLNGSDIEIESSLKPHEIFNEIYSRGVSDYEMYKTFNCGIGFVLSVSDEDLKDIISDLNNSGFVAEIIGKVVKGNGQIKIKSAFSDELVVL
jgi:phosphoribosylformylglycinamidine cyclo-ligase